VSKTRLRHDAKRRAKIQSRAMRLHADSRFRYRSAGMTKYRGQAGVPAVPIPWAKAHRALLLRDKPASPRYKPGAHAPDHDH
jgi:hypothetical protein